MVTLIFGNNNYQARQALNGILQEFTAKEGIERYGGEDLSPNELPNILSGLSLFASNRLIIITDASENKELWMVLGEYLPSVPDEVHLVLYEQTPDKRTKTFKDLQKTAELIETKEPSEPEAISWLVNEAEKRKIPLSPANAQAIVSHTGLDQWQLHFALEKLAGFDEVNEALIQDVIEATPQSSAFALIDAALARQPAKVQSIVKVLRVSEDAYYFFGLLASQLFQLVALSASNMAPGLVAKDLGTHPYPLQKMHGLAGRMTAKNRQTIATIIADCDDHLKRSGAEPWLILEQALLKLATIK